MLGPGGTKASADRFGFTRPPDLADVARWHTTPYDEDSKWFYAFYGGPVDDEGFDDRWQQALDVLLTPHQRVVRLY